MRHGGRPAGWYRLHRSQYALVWNMPYCSAVVKYWNHKGILVNTVGSI
jgi:hypothetical protein